MSKYCINISKNDLKDPKFSLRCLEIFNNNNGNEIYIIPKKIPLEIRTYLETIKMGRFSNSIGKYDFEIFEFFLKMIL